MAVYDLSRLSVLLVEDNTYIRSVFHEMLRHFRVGHVDVADNGADAINVLKTLGGAAGESGLRSFDIVISDLIMAPINGLILLRWVRGAKESPNRFMPFVMLSGAADNEYVAASRDLGVTEFLAKPFSAQSVYRRLLEVIDYPRPFIATRDYFGPDRRRRDVEFEGEDRRVNTEKDLTVVYSSDKIVKPKKASDVWCFHLPNQLKERLGGLGSAEPGEIPTDLLETAEQELQRAALDFTEWARNYLGQLAKLCEEAREGAAAARHKAFEQINLLAHELRGQGGTFGYPLITMFGRMLYEATGTGCPEDDNAIEVVRAHVDAMRAVIRDKVAGDGGEVGRALMKSLKLAIDKHRVVGNPPSRESAPQSPEAVSETN